MNEKEFQDLVAKVGAEAANKIKAEMDGYDAKMKTIAEDAVKNGGGLTKEQFETYKTSSETAINEIKEIAKKQGTTLAQLQLSGGKEETKSIASVFAENNDELKKVYSQRSGTVDFMVYKNSKGEWTARKHDPLAAKAAGPHATIDAVGAAGNTASISQAFGAATLLRMGANADIVSQYRNTPWIFDLINTTQAGWSDLPFVIWFEEQAKQGGSTLVTEGGTKPPVQYTYKLRSSEYKKRAQLLSFTEEFNLDFSRLQSDIIGKGQTDLINQINSDLLTGITNAATAYNTAASFTGGVAFADANDFDVIAALAAQVDNATYGNSTNAAIMSTFKKYRMGVTKSTTGEYIDRPSVLDAVNFIGNPDMAADALLVGDLKQYNAILRGGFIVKVGYNGTDFGENKFSVVQEQFYFDYISDIRKAALVKGPNFADVKTALASVGAGGGE
ncbi:hypothetical protein [Rhizosphaericola mali]|uniref:Phage major capsid protein n=1 Tax=Rhizosphaericola mali TaxID=2545455 RepID=A0A5P2G2B7_9BACT|nr:hypothetical protein [Rhizosphaericola mali]QES88858.1 hypothetical protein E0W69_009390 [Rhizosphaericola mali]